ncbi:MAG: hypothetical protein AAF974_04955 [Cyanobacteria bacterium P01_E01_bin.34]
MIGGLGVAIADDVESLTEEIWRWLLAARCDVYRNLLVRGQLKLLDLPGKNG